MRPSVFLNDVPDDLPALRSHKTPLRLQILGMFICSEQTRLDMKISSTTGILDRQSTQDILQ